MKSILPLCLLSFSIFSAAGSTGPGPWAQGAYYPGQLDGKYAASVSKDPDDSSPTPIGGVIGFGLQAGAPTRLPRPDGTTVTPAVDSASNYYAIFRGGNVFTGTTLGFLNIKSSRVSGSLVPDPTASGTLAQGGGFAGKITANQAIFTFRGNGALGSTLFRLSGIKTSDIP